MIILGAAVTTHRHGQGCFRKGPTSGQKRPADLDHAADHGQRDGEMMWHPAVQLQVVEIRENNFAEPELLLARRPEEEGGLPSIKDWGEVLWDSPILATHHSLQEKPNRTSNNTNMKVLAIIALAGVAAALPQTSGSTSPYKGIPDCAVGRGLTFFSLTYRQLCG